MKKIFSSLSFIMLCAQSSMYGSIMHATHKYFTDNSLLISATCNALSLCYYSLSNNYLTKLSTESIPKVLVSDSASQSDKEQCIDKLNGRDKDYGKKSLVWAGADQAFLKIGVLSLGYHLVLYFLK